MSTERDSDPFAPPEISTEVCCLHCGETYDSWQIEWRTKIDAQGVEHGFWCCPIDGCDGIGFGFDILPTDPDYQDENGGWVHFEDDEDDEEEWIEGDGDIVGEQTPGPPREFDEQVPWDDDEIFPPKKKPPDAENDFPFSVN